jgi:dTDP-4-amino-4,6-dideoxygalactose transaminase
VLSAPAGQRAAFWLTTIRVSGRDVRDRLLSSLRAERIETRPPWRLNHAQAPYRESPSGPLVVAPRLEAEGLHLPSSPSLSEGDQERVIESLLRLLES